MMKIKVTFGLLLSGVMMSSHLLAAQFKIVNNSPYAVECSSLVNASCSESLVKPKRLEQKASQGARSPVLRVQDKRAIGHLMLIPMKAANVKRSQSPYAENIIFSYAKQGKHYHLMAKGLYARVKVRIKNHTIIIG
jgi:hypothetical protein